MTVSTEVDHNDYTGNGVTTSFPYTFRIFKKSDLTVQVADLNENITVLTLDTDYSVTGAGTYSGGNVVLMSPLANGWQISISRDLPVTQETDLRNQGKFFAEVHEDAFDKLTMLIQQCFGFLRLALRKPSFIANYYDALNNRIRNLRDPSQAQDAATKSYVDTTGAENLSHTLRFPEAVDAMLNVDFRANSLQGYNTHGKPIPVFSMTDTADLALKLASNIGPGLIGFDIDQIYPADTIGRKLNNDFYVSQNLQDYYDKHGNWDDAIFEAQCNIVIKNYSPIITLPAKVMVFNKPILGGRALGDAIHAAHPELNFYNPSTDTYAKTWPLMLIGARARWAEGILFEGVGSQIVFSGCATQRDYTYQNSAAIYSGPTNPYDRKTQTAVSQIKWFDTIYMQDVNVRCLNKDSSRLGKVHGIVSLSGKCLLKNITAYQFYGAGIYLDWNFEPIVEGCAVIQCGRMADALPGPGTTDDFITLGRTTKEFQTYGPVHIGYSAAGSDNTNFVSFRDLHVEDNYYAAVDIIVSGNASPVRIYDVHFECDPIGIGSLGKKWAIGAGRYGVRYFGQDTEPDFNPASTPYTARAGFVSLNNVTGYSANYAGYYAGKGYSGCLVSNATAPNIGSVEVNGSNADAYFYAVNTNPSTINFLGGNSNPIPLKLSNCKARSIVMSYASGYMLSNTEVTEGITIDNELTNPQGGWHHSNVIAASIEGVINYGSGDISLTSTSVQSNLVCYRGDVCITRYAYYNYLLGVS